MGFDKLLNFISKNLNLDSIEELNIETKVKKIVANNIMFDISFLIYQSLIEIEEEVNNIIKIILSLPFNFLNNIVQDKILEIISQDHWCDCKIILDGFNEIDIIKNFKDTLNQENILNKIVTEKIFNSIVNNISKIHCIEIIQYINIIFDGIPSYSKILEQRRRRLRNYIESQEKKKKYDEKFKNLENTIEEYNEINYDYFKWVKNKFIIDKSFGPISPIIIFLEEHLYKKLTEKYPTIKIYINQGKYNGEADYKIFKSIYEKNYEGDICIHTIDSDLVHQIIVQQNYFNIINKDIKLIVVRYNYKNKHIQYIDANKIIKNIDKVYYEITNKNITNKNIIYDICLFLLFFGNDHLPSSFEIGPEISLEYLLKTYYNIFKNEKTIISININNNIEFSFENFCLYLKEIYKNNEINKTKIVLSRFLKINYNITNYLTEKQELNLNQIIELSKKVLFDSGKKIDNLDETDIRYNLVKNYETINLSFEIKYNDDEFEQYKEKLLQILDKTNENIDYNGLPIHNNTCVYNNKNKYLTDNNYLNIYNFFLEDINEELQKTNKYIFDYLLFEDIKDKDNVIIDINIENEICHSYLKKIYHLVKTLFGNMINYNCNNFTYYKFYETPKLISIINYLENNKKINFDNEIENENATIYNYFNTINHHLIITPYIKQIMWKVTSYDIINIINNLNINHLWYNNEENFEFKQIDIESFFKAWKYNIKKYNSTNNEIYLLEYNN
jgi:hypothetical protein